MRLIPKNIPLRRKSVNLYRSIRHRKGYGVHSPFVFDLITKVIEESRPYYIYKDIEQERKKLSFHKKQITYRDYRQAYAMHTCPIGRLVKREAISPKQGKLLFRLVNYFHSRTIVQLGPTIGLSTLYLTSCAKGIKCIALEPVPEFAEIADDLFRTAARNPIDLRVGAYRELLPQALVDIGQPDLVFFNTLYAPEDNEWLFEAVVRQVHPGTLLVFVGIRENHPMRVFWEKICAHPAVTVTIDLYTVGLVFFDPKLHKRDYVAYF